VVRLERDEERPRGRPAEPKPAIATPAEVVSQSTTEAAPAPAGPFTIEVPRAEPLVVGGALPAPSAEGLVHEQLAPDLAALAEATAAADDARLRLLLFAVVTLS